MPELPDCDLARVRAFCESRTPAHVRDELRIEAEVSRTAVTIVERRPPWDGDGMDWLRSPVAQMRFESKTERWALYWPDRNDRWRRYDDLEPTSVERVLDEIGDDPTCIFWG
jgi:hypothetical protein